MAENHRCESVIFLYHFSLEALCRRIMNCKRRTLPLPERCTLWVLHHRGSPSGVGRQLHHLWAVRCRLHRRGEEDCARRSRRTGQTSNPGCAQQGHHCCAWRSAPSLAAAADHPVLHRSLKRIPGAAVDPAAALVPQEPPPGPTSPTAFASRILPDPAIPPAETPFFLRRTSNEINQPPQQPPQRRCNADYRNLQNLRGNHRM